MAERRCLGCRRSDSKEALLRFVAQDGRLVADREGTLPGRGAYVHPDRECVSSSLRRKAWSAGLKISGGLDVREVEDWEATASH
jgi:uncharacterized protein